jgi:hypothetical protein
MMTPDPSTGALEPHFNARDAALGAIQIVETREE